MKLPCFKTMSPDRLREAYREFRGSAYRGGQVASQNPSVRGTVRRVIATSWGEALRACEIIERVADKRGISLRGQPERDDAVDFRCSNCGGHDLTGSSHCEGCRRVAETKG